MNEKIKNILLIILIVGLVAMTVAFAALTTNLKVTGTATVAETRWDIRFEDYGVGTGNNVTAPTITAALANSSITKLSNVDVTLNKPGDKLVYIFKIKNNGTIPAKKNSFSMSITPATGTSGTAQTGTSYGTLTIGPVDYTVNCVNDTPLAASAYGTCTLTVEYKNIDTTSSVTGHQASQTPGQNQTANIGAGTYTINAEWSYIQNN